MAGPSEFKKYMDSLHSGLFEKVFEKQTTSLNFASFETVADQRIKDIADVADARQAEELVGVKAGRSVIRSASIGTIGLSSAGSGPMSARTISTAALTELMPSMGVNTAGGQQNITLAWDQLRNRNLMGRMAPTMGAGQSLAPTVSVSGMWSKFFGDVPFEGKKNLGNISEAIEKGRGSGKNVGSMKFLSAAANAITSEAGAATVGELSKAQQLRVIFSAAADKAMQDKAGMEFFKQYLTNSGVAGINTSARALWNVTDPHGINLISSISGRARGMAYFSPANVGRGSIDQSTFLRKVGKVYGKDYSGMLGEFIEWSTRNSAGGVAAADHSRVAFAMSHTGGIYMGQHGMSDTFMGIAAERLGTPGLPKGAGGGMPQGFQMVGDKIASARMTAAAGDTLESATQIFFREMQAGMAGPGGMGFSAGQIGAAIKSGHRQAMGAIKEIRQPFVSRGKHALFGGVYDTATINAGQGAFKHFNSLTTQLMETSMGMNTPADYYSRLIQALEKDIADVGGMGFTRGMGMQAMAQLETIGAEGLAGIKGTNLLEGILPNAAMSQFFLPGQLMTEAALSKGLYQRRGVEEIREISRIRAIQTSRRLLGMEPIAHTISSTSGNSAARMSMGRVVDSAIGRSLGLGQQAMRRGMKPIVTLPLMTTVLDTGAMGGKQALQAAEIFGDAGAVYQGTGKAAGSVFAGLRRQLPKQETFATGAQLEQFLLGVSGGSSRVKTAMRRLREGTRPSGRVFFDEDNPLRIANRKFALDIGADAQGQRMSWQVPKGLRGGFVTGFELPQPSRVGMDPVKVFYDTAAGTPSHVSIAMNDVRMTARAASDDVLQSLLKLNQQGRTTLGRLGDVVTQAADMSKFGRAAEWTHRIGLLGFDPTNQMGGAGKLPRDVAQRYSGYEGRAARFRSLMEQDTAGLVERVTTGVDTEIIPGRGYTAGTGAADFNAASERVLRKMGYTEAQIKAEMWGGRKGARTISGGMAQLQLMNAPGYSKMGGTWKQLEQGAKTGSLSGLGAQEQGVLNLFSKSAGAHGMDMWSMVTAANFRAGETEELRGMFRVRLSALTTQAETLPTYMRGVKGLGGANMTLGQHPVLRLHAEHLAGDSHYGGWLNMEAKLASEMVDTKHVGLKGISNLFRGMGAQYMGTGGANQLAAHSGWDVLSLQQANKRFGQVGSQMFSFGGGAIPAEEALKSGLFDPKVNKGFYIDLGAKGGPGAVDLRGRIGKDLKGMAPEKARYMPIPAAAELRRMAGQGLRAGQVWRPQADTMLDAAFRLVSHSNLDPTRAIDNVTQDAALLYNSLARMGGKGGFLTDDVFSRAGLPGAGSARLLPNVAGASQVTQGTAAGLTAADYTASVGEAGLKKLLKDDKAVTEIMKRFEAGQDVFAFVQPTPLHSAHQAKVVRLKLDTALKAGSGGAELGLGSFLTWAMQRDNDKDNAFIHVLRKNDMDRVAKLSKEGKVLGLSDTLNEQILSDTAQGKIYKKAMLTEAKAAEMFTHGRTVTSMGEAVTQVRALASFGTFAATPFTGMMQTKGLLDQIAGGNVNFFQQTEVAEMFRTQVSDDMIKGWTSTAEKHLSGGLGGKVSLTTGVQEFAALHQPIFQGGIQKADSKVNAFINSFLGSQSKMIEMARQGQSQDEIFHYAHKKMTDYLTALTDGGKSFEGFKDFKPSVQRIIGNVGDVAESSAARLAFIDEGARNLAANLALAGTVRGAHMKEGRAAQQLLSLAEREAMDIPAAALGVRDAANRALRSTEGSLESIFRFLHGGESMVGMGRELESSQAAAAQALDDSIGGIKQASSEIMDWSVRNWKIVAGVGVGIAAIKAAGALFGGDEMPAPSFSSARSLQFPQSNLAPGMTPRSNDPGVQFDQGGFSSQRAMVQPMNSQYAMSSMQGTASSVNIAGIGSSVAANVGNFSNPHVNMSIRDSRSYSSNWEMQNAANQRGRSAFIHPYMGDLA